mmetsp:Transcript_99116/g.303033  ORF Transcript_99116/g.303033 Transcript_99116/m.303033 type:complete len:263 (-) Transcript_99116:626-1414(-)
MPWALPPLAAAAWRAAALSFRSEEVASSSSLRSRSPSFAAAARNPSMWDFSSWASSRSTCMRSIARSYLLPALSRSSEFHAARLASSSACVASSVASNSLLRNRSSRSSTARWCELRNPAASMSLVLVNVSKSFCIRASNLATCRSSDCSVHVRVSFWISDSLRWLLVSHSSWYNLSFSSWTTLNLWKYLLQSCIKLLPWLSKTTSLALDSNTFSWAFLYLCSSSSTFCRKSCSICDRRPMSTWYRLSTSSSFSLRSSRVCL